jgi:hypothetical protein
MFCSFDATKIRPRKLVSRRKRTLAEQKKNGSDAKKRMFGGRRSALPRRRRTVLRPRPGTPISRLNVQSKAAFKLSSGSLIWEAVAEIVVILAVTRSGVMAVAAAGNKHALHGRLQAVVVAAGVNGRRHSSKEVAEATVTKTPEVGTVIQVFAAIVTVVLCGLFAWWRMWR